MIPVMLYDPVKERAEQPAEMRSPQAGAWKFRKARAGRLVIALQGIIFAFGAIYSHMLTGIQRSIAGGGKMGWFCGGDGWSDCSRTLGSTYSVVLGLPVTIYASAWFAFLLALLLGGVTRKEEPRSMCRMLFWAILPGVGVTLFYAGISALVLQTFCLYCAGLYLFVGLSAALSFAGMEIGQASRKLTTDYTDKHGYKQSLFPCRSVKSVVKSSSFPFLAVQSFSFLKTLALPSVVFLGVVFTEWTRSLAHSVDVDRNTPAPRAAQVVAHYQDEPEFAHLPRLGSSQAKLRIIKFTDFQCSACRFSAKELHRFMSKHPGAVELRCVNIPLHHMKSGKDLLSPAFLAARMGMVMQKRGQFWPYYEGIYLDDRPVDDALVWKVVTAIVGQYHLAAVRQEVDSAEILAALAADIALARQCNVQRTPSLIINDHLEIGALDEKEWEAQLASASAEGHAIAETSK